MAAPFERHKHELFIISINSRPDGYVFQRSGYKSGVGNYDRRPIESATAE